MYVVIAGGGVLGLGLAARLVEARHDVVLVEQDRAVASRLPRGWAPWPSMEPPRT